MVVALIVCIGAIAFLGLVVLGTMREVVILRGEVNALMGVMTTDPPPSFKGKRLPKRVLDRLPRAQVGRPGRHVLLAMGDGCAGCHILAESIEREDGGDRRLASRLTCVVRTDSPDGELVELARRVSDNVLVDDSGDLIEALEARTTPALYVVDTVTEEVVDYKLGGDPEWIERALSDRPTLVVEEVVPA